ncbi:MAG: ROK family protein, partial [bacterium]
EIFHAHEGIDGIALSMPGAVDSDRGIIGGASALDYIHGPCIKKDLEDRCHVPVEMENDANCAALAEVWLGSAKEVNDACFVVVGTGVGGAVIKDRRIHKGIHLHGGEFGYMIAAYDLEKGDFYHWSTFSTIGILKGVARDLQIPEESLSGQEIFDQADVHPVYGKHVDRFYYALAMGIYNIQYAYDPEVIIIGGGVSERPDLLEQIDCRLDRIFASITDAHIRPTIKKCQFGNSAGIIGAIYHLMTKQKDES